MHLKAFDYLPQRLSTTQIKVMVWKEMLFVYWRVIYNDVPRGSISGPVLFNSINDIFNFVKECELYNYVDDNTLSCSDCNIDTVKSKLENDSQILISWCSDNHMKSNADKFQAIAIGKTLKTELHVMIMSPSNIIRYEYKSWRRTDHLFNRYYVELFNGTSLSKDISKQFCLKSIARTNKRYEYFKWNFWRKHGNL